MTNMSSQRFSTNMLDFVNGQREAGAWLSDQRARKFAARSPSAPPARTPSRVRATTRETTAPQIHADACRLYAAGQYAQARTKFLGLVGGAVLADAGHYGLACIAARRGDLVTARSHLLRVVALNPRHRPAVNALARIGGAHT
jgi:hypothetical protein